ncbi:hypothetical protein MN116_006341 [Schistosoma mekongi]|uniref:Uncharacterized protein n=1 Tax=Schistosoma mekongi TaxID=38744 RepID=A0AAE1ZCD6_SCHME|nr:hypothetical protein MN116_006341 [Schistosoma mekongi]
MEEIKNVCVISAVGFNDDDDSIMVIICYQINKNCKTMLTTSHRQTYTGKDKTTCTLTVTCVIHIYKEIRKKLMVRISGIQNSPPKVAAKSNQHTNMDYQGNNRSR